MESSTELENQCEKSCFTNDHEPNLGQAGLEGFDESYHQSELSRLEEEQEELNNSLLALTSHFAQVQFRLKQIVDAPVDEKEDLLKSLEQFAFKGIPDARPCTSQSPLPMNDTEGAEYKGKFLEQREKQQELINQLKTQLEDLETYEYEMGEADLPTSKVLEKQKILIDQLTHRLNLQLEDMNKLGPDDLRKIVDNAVGKIVYPGKVKEKVVEQLKTQITDLERFISFLQGDAQTPGPLGSKCTCPKHGEPTKFTFENHAEVDKTNKKSDSSNSNNNMRETALSIMKQALTILQLFTISQLGCGSKEFQRNLLKRTTKNSHWGDLRARLELAIAKVMEVVEKDEKTEVADSDYTSDLEDAPVIQCNKDIVMAVRKEFSSALRDLLQHGLMEVGQSTSLVTFGCLAARSNRNAKMMHAWDLFLKYYEMKHGKEYNDSPARKLSQSFHLDIVGGKAITTKQNLLSGIDSVLSSHRPLKRSDDMQFKAFICLALNEKSLSKWLRLVLKCHPLIEYYYQPWSYVVRTGFDDALQSLDRLSSINFKLPVDLAVRPFNNIQDAF